MEIIHGRSWRGIDSHLNMWFHYRKVRGLKFKRICTLLICNVFGFLDEVVYASLSHNYARFVEEVGWRQYILPMPIHGPLWIMVSHAVMSISVLSYLSHAIRIVPIVLIHMIKLSWLPLQVPYLQLLNHIAALWPIRFCLWSTEWASPMPFTQHHCHYHLPLRLSPCVYHLISPCLNWHESPGKESSLAATLMPEA
jgi:hypothetical protein